MPRSYSDNERVIIKQQLMKHAIDCMKQYGMQKTTVDELVKRCRIAKGSFYSFYPSKEMLFWDVLMKWHEDIDKMMMESVEKCDEISVESFTELIFNCYMECMKVDLGSILFNGDIDYLMRKLPPEIMEQHMNSDDDMIKNLISMIPDIDMSEAETFAGAFRGIFLFLMYKDQVGDNFEEVLKLTIRGVVIQLLAKTDNSKKDKEDK